jgi:hypothetical protein
LTLFLTGVVAIGLAAFGPEGGAFVLVAIALGFPAVFLRELARPAPREDLVRSVTGTTCGVVAVAAMGLWVTAGVMEHFVDLAIEAGTGIAAACLGIGLGRLAPRWKGEIGAGLGLLLAVGAGAGVSFLVVTPWWAGAAVAAVCAVAPGGLGLIGESRSVLAARLSLSDAAVFTLPLAVASVPVWAAALMR